MDILNGSFGANGEIGRAGASTDIFDGDFGPNLTLKNVDVFGGTFESVVASWAEFEGGDVSGVSEFWGGAINGGTFNHVIGTLNIGGGIIKTLDTKGGRIAAGLVQGHTQVRPHSQFSAYGGDLNTVHVGVGAVFDIFDGTMESLSARGEFYMRGGTILDSVELQADATGIKRGGSVHGDWLGQAGSETPLTGGTIEGNVLIYSTGDLRLAGTSFCLVETESGKRIEDLTPIIRKLQQGEFHEIVERDVTLQGVLSDGSSIELELNSTLRDMKDYIASDARVLLCPEPRVLGIVPDETTVFRGFLADGILDDLNVSDDFSITMHPGFVLGSDPPTWLVFEANIPKETQQLSFNVETRVGTPGIIYGMEVWNYSTGWYEMLDFGDSNFGQDAVFTIQLSPEVHLNDAGRSRCRMYWRKSGFTINNPWQVFLDHVFWTAK